MESNRKPKPKELEMIEALIIKANYCPKTKWKETLKVGDINDGMGSLRLYENENTKHGEFLKFISEICIKDSDGINVFLSLGIDTVNELYELDIWKVDFTEVNFLNTDNGKN